MKLLKEHYATAQKMLGAARNPKLWKADELLKQFADERGMGHTFRATDVGAYFGEAGVNVPDPFFGGEGPDRAGCQHCGGCMVGCRYNAKNTLPKNYLYFAEKMGTEVNSEVEVTDVKPLTLDDGPSTGDGQAVEGPLRSHLPRLHQTLQADTNRPRKECDFLGKCDGDNEIAVESARCERLAAQTVAETRSDGQDQLRGVAGERGAQVRYQLLGRRRHFLHLQL